MSAKKNNLKNINNKLIASDLMPNDKASQSILINRAKILAMVNEVNDDKSASQINYIKFKLGLNEFYGIPYEKVKEVMNNFLLTPVPNLPPFVVGVINLRGTLIAVISLKILFSIPDASVSESSQIIVVNKENMVVGILVDSIIGNDVYDPSLLDLPILSQSITSDFILGINQGNTAIINIETILANSKLHLDKKEQVIQ